MPRSTATTPQTPTTQSKTRTPSKSQSKAANDKSSRKNNDAIDIFDDLEGGNTPRRNASAKKNLSVSKTVVETPRKRGRPPLSQTNTPTKSGGSQINGKKQRRDVTES